MVRQAVVFAGFFLLTFLFMQLSLHPSGGTRRGGHRQQQNIYSPSTSGSEPTSQALTEPPVIDHSKISVVNGDMSRNLVRLDTSATNLDPLPGKVEAQRRPYPADVREKYESAMKCPGAPSGRCDETTFTIFAAPKPMSRPHIALIQRNAVRSWLNLVPKPKVIIFGEGEGLAEFAAAEGIKHVRDVNMLRFKHETMPSLGPLFRSASEHAVTKTLVFTNADILFPQAFADALMTCNNASDAFLMMVPRNRIQLTWDINFTDPEWDVRLFHHCDLVSPNCKTDSYRALDTFSYTRATYHAVEIPPFAIGRPAYDNFLIHAAVWNRVPLVGTHTLLRVWHQNHDYTHINDKSSNSSAVNGWSPTLWSGEGSAYNRRILNDRGNRAFETDGSQLQATFMIETQTKGCPTVPYRFGNCRLRLKRYANKLSVGFHPIPCAIPCNCANRLVCLHVRHAVAPPSSSYPLLSLSFDVPLSPPPTAASRRPSASHPSSA